MCIMDNIFLVSFQRIDHNHWLIRILAQNEFVFINFYADWCRFSNMLAPIWDEAADKISKELGSGKVVVGKVDCDKHGKYFLANDPILRS